MNLDRRSASLAVASFSLGLPLGLRSARAADYPDRPIHAVIGFAAGSGADVFGRYYTHKLEQLAGVPVVVDNKPGASSNIALRYVSDARPDGYTILLSASSNMAGSRFLYKSLPFDTMSDFRPVASFAEIGFVLVVSPKSKVNTLVELIAKLRGEKDALYGYSDQTALFTSELFKQLAGVAAKPVAYKSSPDTMRDLTDETLDFVIMDGTFAAGQVNQGAVKAIAVNTSRRLPTFPDVPTFTEAGLNGFDFVTWKCMYVPKNTPQAVVDKLEGYMHQINRMPETEAFLKASGALMLDDGPDRSNERLRADMPRWENLVKLAGIQPQ